MAWTAKSDRFGPKHVLAAPTEVPDTVGPGSYIAHTSHDPKPHYAPFSTSSLRLTGADDPLGPAQTPAQVGPGAYDPKKPRSYDSGLPRKTFPFHSSTVKNTDLADPSARKKPGPGAYELKLKLAEEKHSCRTMGVPQGERRSVFRSSSAPSIPRTDQCHGYEEAGDGRLLRMRPRNESQTFTGTDGDTTGPGQYDQSRRPNLKQAPNFRFGKGEARGDWFGTKNTPAPNHYNPKANVKAATVSSCFVSESDRLNFFPDAKNPGPGSYQTTGRIYEETLRDLHPELQYFGSTTERFKGGGASKAPGPGAYAPGSQPKPPPKRSWCFADRFNYGVGAKPQPGPGAYDTTAETKTSGPTGTVSILGSTGSLAFGSMQSRKTQVPEGRAPGPGAYQVVDVGDGVHGPGGKLSTGKKGTKHAVFASESAKDTAYLRAVKDGQSKPPVGAYEPKHASDIGAVMRLPPKAEGFLAQRERVMLEGAGNRAPGPGKYNPAIGVTACRPGCSFNRSYSEGAPPATGKNSSLGFDVQANRFESKPPSKRMPGPGAYSPSASLIKKTHNVNFGDV